MGSTRITALVEDLTDWDLSVFPELRPCEREQIEGKQMPWAFFCVENEGGTMLIDAGLGVETVALLRRIGVDRSSVTDIFITHLDYDHVRGLVWDGSPTFPNARIWVPQRDHRHFLEVERGEDHDTWLRVWEVVRARVELFEAPPVGGDGLRLTPAITAFAAPGHSPGHSVFLLETPGVARVLFAGDFLDLVWAQPARPDLCSAWDRDATATAATRRAILSWALATKTALAGPHLPMPCVVDVAAHGEAWQLLPSPLAVTCVGPLPGERCSGQARGPS